MQLGGGVRRAGQRAAAEAGRPHAEVAPVLLHHHVGGDLGGAEDGVQARVDRHVLGDARPAYGWPGSISQRVSSSTSGRRVGPVAVHLVGGAVDERRLDAVLAHVLQHVERADGVDVEVGERVADRPVVATAARRCGSPRAMSAAVPLEDLRRARPGRGCRRRGGCTPSPSSLVSRRTFHAVDASAPKNCRRMSLSMPTTSQAEAGEVPDRLRADQTARSGHQRDSHTTLLVRGWRMGTRPARSITRGRRATLRRRPGTTQARPAGRACTGGEGGS